jgi:hypothetical protein
MNWQDLVGAVGGFVVFINKFAAGIVMYFAKP